MGEIVVAELLLGAADAVAAIHRRTWLVAFELVAMNLGNRITAARLLVTDCFVVLQTVVNTERGARLVAHNLAPLELWVGTTENTLSL